MASREIVALTVEGPVLRTNWGEVATRAHRFGHALTRLGITPGDRVATLAWNTHRHVEAWYGISGIGGVAHTINPRLFREQIAYIANHAEDRVLAFDMTFLDFVEKLAPELKTIEHYILLTDRAHMPADSSLNLLCYEDLLADADPAHPWADLDENDPAGLCYTSGTTGNPKGVLYSHRSNVLHAFAACMADTFAISARTSVLPIAPMFHANSWGIPYAAAMAGAKLVLNGPNFDGPTLTRVIVEEGVNFSLAVPTVWLSILQHLEATGGNLGQLERVAIGGSAVPRAMIEAFRDRHKVTVGHLWGMTEMSPLGTAGLLCPDVLERDPEGRVDAQLKQGRGMFGVEMKIVGDDGTELPRDGKAFGALLVRGPWIVAEYFKGDGGNVLDADGWFDTGDVATIDTLGYMQIVDRSKDVIKSGGEWISSIELENEAVGAPGVAEAAVIGVYHPKWDERPLLLVRAKPGETIDPAAVRAHLATRVAKWWLPEAIEVVDDLPHTATGKLLKTELRARYRDYRFATT